MLQSIDFLIFLTSFLIILHHIFTFPLNDNAIEEGTVDLSYLGANAFLSPDPETGKRLETWNETSPINPEEYGEYAEGDILFPRITKNGIIGEAFRWKNGIIPYEIAGYFPSKDLEKIKKAIEIYKKYTCITFRPKVSSDRDYISILNGNTGCWSSVGRIGGRQEVNLQSLYCTTKVGTPLHELMHAAGFLHEQNRHERDDYVSIAWKNIKKGHENNFNKAEKGKEQGFGVTYDYKSVMHYSNKAFSVNSQPTIIPKDPEKAAKMGQRDGFSKGDITKINAMYNCPEKTLAVTGENLDIEIETGKSEEASNPLLEAATGLLSFLFT